MEIIGSEVGVRSGPTVAAPEALGQQGQPPRAATAKVRDVLEATDRGLDVASLTTVGFGTSGEMTLLRQWAIFTRHQSDI